MNNTRRIKTFIGAMMLASVITAGYAGFVSHTLHAYFALAVLALAADRLHCQWTAGRAVTESVTFGA